MKKSAKKRPKPRWDCGLQKLVSRPDIEDFVTAILAVYKKHRLALGHEDAEGGFLIGPLSKDSEKRLLGASIVPACPSCKKIAYLSHSAETMGEIVNDPSEKILSCGVGPWGYLCATNQSGSVITGGRSR